MSRPEFVARTWERLTWGPFYFVRRTVCWLRGHDWHIEYRCEVDFHGERFCARCLEGA